MRCVGFSWDASSVTRSKFERAIGIRGFRETVDQAASFVNVAVKSRCAIVILLFVIYD
jgi:hypothetical protein